LPPWIQWEIREKIYSAPRPACRYYFKQEEKSFFNALIKP